MTALLVREVQSQADVAAFMAAGKRAQSGNSRWIEPLHDEMLKVFDKKRSPLMLENEIQPFVAYLDGQPAGRIVAVVNRAHLEKYRDSCGHFGVIDAIDDRDVFAALLQHAAGFLRARGLRRMRGPFSLSINHEAGILVKGFDQPHVAHTNHAPPYYGHHIEALGFRKAMDLFAYVCRIAESNFPGRVAKTANRFEFRQGDPNLWSVADALVNGMFPGAAALQRRLEEQLEFDSGQQRGGQTDRGSYPASRQAVLDQNCPMAGRGHRGRSANTRRQ